MARLGVVVQFEERVAFLIDEAITAAAVECNRVDAEFTTAGSYGGARQIVVYGIEVEKAGTNALAEMLASFDIAKRRLGAREEALVETMRVGLDRYIRALLISLSVDPAFGARPDRLLDSTLFGVLSKLLRRINQHLTGLTIAQPSWSDRNPLVKDGLLVLLGATLAFLGDLLVGKG